MKKVLILFLFIAWSGKIFSQCYTVDSIPYTPSSFSGTQLLPFSDDDQFYYTMTPIGFSFCFYGDIYTQVAIGSNGIISFNLSDNNYECFWHISSPIPNTLSTNNNTIMLPWQDLNVGGHVSYAQYGIAPNRSFVVSFDSVPMLGNFYLKFSGQAILYETSNIIEIYLQNKPVCATWDGGKAIEGVLNSLHTMAATVPGRNATQWTATNDAWRFTPSCNVCTGVGINEITSDENSISVFPNPATNQFTIESGQMKIKSVEIYDVVGEKIIYLTPNPSPHGEGSASIDVSKLTTGIYFITITDENKNHLTKKFVKM